MHDHDRTQEIPEPQVYIAPVIPLPVRPQDDRQGMIFRYILLDEIE